MRPGWHLRRFQTRADAAQIRCDVLAVVTGAGVLTRANATPGWLLGAGPDTQALAVVAGPVVDGSKVGFSCAESLPGCTDCPLRIQVTIRHRLIGIAGVPVLEIDVDAQMYGRGIAVSNAFGEVGPCKRDVSGCGTQLRFPLSGRMFEAGQGN